MSGVVNKNVADKAVSVGADELIRKPFQPQDLIARVKDFLWNQNPSSPPAPSVPVPRAPSSASLTSLFARHPLRRQYPFLSPRSRNREQNPHGPAHSAKLSRHSLKLCRTLRLRHAIRSSSHSSDTDAQFQCRYAQPPTSERHRHPKAQNRNLAPRTLDQKAADRITDRAPVQSSARTTRKIPDLYRLIRSKVIRTEFRGEIFPFETQKTDRDHGDKRGPRLRTLVCAGDRDAYAIRRYRTAGRDDCRMECIFQCILIHECGHMIAAQRQGCEEMVEVCSTGLLQLSCSPGNLASLRSFRLQVIRRWLRALRRRSQKIG